jgi:transcriptional regulator with XRE-family HTH domain
MNSLLLRLIRMGFPDRLVALRKAKGFTQQAMADAIGINVTQVKRYEAGQSQPSLEALRKIALALSVTTDSLLFDEGERGPDDELKLQFEAVAQLPPEDRQAVKALLEGMIVKHQTRQMVESLSG